MSDLQFWGLSAAVWFVVITLLSIAWRPAPSRASRMIERGLAAVFGSVAVVILAGTLVRVIAVFR